MKAKNAILGIIAAAATTFFADPALAAKTKYQCKLSKTYPNTPDYYAKTVEVAFDNVPGEAELKMDFHTPENDQRLARKAELSGMHGPYGGDFLVFKVWFARSSGIEYYSLYVNPPTGEKPISDALGGFRLIKDGKYAMSELLCEQIP